MQGTSASGEKIHQHFCGAFFVWRFSVVVNILHISHFKSPTEVAPTDQAAPTSRSSSQPKRDISKNKIRWYRLMLVMRHVARCTLDAQTHKRCVSCVFGCEMSRKPVATKRNTLRIWKLHCKRQQAGTLCSKWSNIMRCGAEFIIFFFFLLRLWEAQQRTSSEASGSKFGVTAKRVLKKAAATTLEWRD